MPYNENNDERNDISLAHLSVIFAARNHYICSMLYQMIVNITVNHIQNRYGDNISYANKILTAMRFMLDGSKYVFPAELYSENLFPEKKDDGFQDLLAKVNEKEARRKKEGVYYTDRDATDFLAANTLLHYCCSGEKGIWGIRHAEQRLGNLSDEQKSKIVNATVMDPTCGTGEFLLSVLRIKIKAYSLLGLNKPEVLLNTLFGNDIAPQSTDITKLRIFFLWLDSLGNQENLTDMVDILNRNFTNVDAVVYDGNTFGKKDIFIGNPPYVEYRDFDGKPQFNYGNVYADVLHHAVDSLEPNGIMAFVIPLSFVSTARMFYIRDYVREHTDKQIVMNFADRPDCLFSCVHQKLTILLAQKNAEYKGALSSSYKYWYQAERAKLFDGISLAPTRCDNAAFWPKLGNKTEVALYNKFAKISGQSILDFSGQTQNAPLFINKRGCFWMKVFAKDMASDSYGKYLVPKEILPFAYCLFNSSLFFVLWIIISDGWHITNKELCFIKIPQSIPDVSVWSDLMTRLDARLEETKAYVHTKQVDYEYKHRACKDIIDEIDDELAKVFRLSSVQLNYVKSFGLKYRIGDGA